MNAAIPFIPIVFLRLILNEITIGGNMQRVFLYVLFMALATLVGELAVNALGTWSGIQTERTLRK